MLCAKEMYPRSTVLKMETHIPMRPFGHSTYPPPFDKDPEMKKPYEVARTTPEDLIFNKSSRERGPGEMLSDFARRYPPELHEKATLKSRREPFKRRCRRFADPRLRYSDFL